MRPPLRSRTLRGIGRWVAGLLLVALLALLWPQSLGGRVAYVRVSGRSMLPTLHEQDLAVVVREPSYRVGDAVAYRVPAGDIAAGAVVIHRVVGGDGVAGFTTRGDALPAVDSWQPRASDVLGRVVLHVPRAGQALAELTRPWALGLLVAGLTVLVTAWPPRRPRGRAVVLVRVGDSGPAPRRRGRRHDPLATRAVRVHRTCDHVRRRHPHRRRPARRRAVRRRRPSRRAQPSPATSSSAAA